MEPPDGGDGGGAGNLCALVTCDEDSTCSAESGEAVCECNAGYARSSGDDAICEDADECADDPCSVNASCENEVGSFTCACDVGFEGDGFTCTNIDECSLDTHDCDTTTMACVDTEGSWECVIPDESVVLDDSLPTTVIKGQTLLVGVEGYLLADTQFTVDISSASASAGVHYELEGEPVSEYIYPQAPGFFSEVLEIGTFRNVTEEDRDLTVTITADGFAPLVVNATIQARDPLLDGLDLDGEWQVDDLTTPLTITHEEGSNYLVIDPSFDFEGESCDFNFVDDGSAEITPQPTAAPFALISFEVTAGSDSCPSTLTDVVLEVSANQLNLVFIEPGPLTHSVIRRRLRSERFTPRASDTYTNSWGKAVAIDGDWFITSEITYEDQNDGSVKFYARQADTWVDTQTIDKSSSIEFGAAVDIHGDLAISGATHDRNTGISTNYGSAFIYRYDSTSETWEEDQVLDSPEQFDGDLFGSDVAIFGSTALVAGLHQPAGGSSFDRYTVVYLYEHDGMRWEYIGKLQDSMSSDELLPDLAGGRMLYDSITYDSGRVLIGNHVFEEVAGAWTNTHTLTAPDMGPDFARYDSYISGDRITISDPGQRTYNSATVSWDIVEARVHVYEFDGLTWSLLDTVIQAMPSDDLPAYDLESAIVDDYLFVHSDRYFKVYERVGNAWVLYTSVNHGWTIFSLDISGDDLVLGSPFYDYSSFGPREADGSTFVYDLSVLP